MFIKRPFFFFIYFRARINSMNGPAVAESVDGPVGQVQGELEGTGREADAPADASLVPRSA